MTAPVTELLERTVTAATPEQMTVGMPDVHVALREMGRRRGELFCNFGFTGIDIGTIPEEGPVMTFSESRYGNNERGSGYVNIQHDGAIRYPLTNSGRFGGVPIESGAPTEHTKEISEYIGEVPAHQGTVRPLPHGPTVVDFSGDVNRARQYDITRDALVIGTRAVGAFALGKALKELDTNPRSCDISLGLLIAAHLEKTGEDWRPRNGRAGKVVDKIIETLRTSYIEEALVPATLRELDLSKGWPPHSTSIGNRLPLFGMTYAEANELLAGRVNQAIDENDGVKAAYDNRKREHGIHGDFDSYLSVNLQNFLRNKLGLTNPPIN